MSLELIVFGADYHGHPSSTHHLVRQLLIQRPEARVLWVNSLGMRKPNLTAQDMGRLWHRAKRLVRHSLPKQVAPRLHVLDPMTLPLPGSRAAQALNRQVFGAQIAAARRWIGMKQPIVLSALPNCVGLLDAINPKAVIYYCLDDYSRMPGVDGDAIGLQEQELAHRSDLILITGEHLREHLEGAGTPIEYLPHGVDLGRFQQEVEVHPLLASIKGPRIGFFGALDTWLDLDLVARVAAARPDWQFPIIGPSRVDVSMLEAQPNVHLLGAVPFEEIPAVAAGFDIGLLPFEVNTFTQAINPLKLREYFAAGVPAVSTSLPEVAKFAPLAAIADDVEGTVAAIEQMLSQPPAQDALYKAVAGESWRARALDFLHHIDQYQLSSPAKQRAQAAPSLRVAS